MFKLKPGQPNIEIMDGPDRGKKFVAGRPYDEVPASEAHRFEEVPVMSLSNDPALNPASQGGKKK